MSPASGNVWILYSLDYIQLSSFHSINVPSEWEHLSLSNGENILQLRCFHSINVPSEWEPYSGYPMAGIILVSIQLMSPASGNTRNGDRAP